MGASKNAYFSVLHPFYLQRETEFESDLVHSSDKVVDFIFSVTEVTSFDEVIDDFSVSTGWG